MAQTPTTVQVPGGTWTQLNSGDATTVVFQNLGPHPVYIKATTDGTAPTTISGAFVFQPFEGNSTQAILDIFPGLTGADNIWAFATGPAAVVVNHA